MSASQPIACDPLEGCRQRRQGGGRPSPYARHAGRVIELLRAGASYAEVTAETGVPKHAAIRIRKQAGVPYGPRRCPRTEATRRAMQDPERRAAVLARLHDPAAKARSLATLHLHLVGLPGDRRDDYRLFRRKGFSVSEALILARAVPGNLRHVGTGRDPAPRDVRRLQR